MKAYARKPLGPPQRNIVPDRSYRNGIDYNGYRYYEYGPPAYENYFDYPDYYNGYFSSESDSENSYWYSDSDSYYSNDEDSSYYDSSSYNTTSSSESDENELEMNYYDLADVYSAYANRGEGKH